MHLRIITVCVAVLVGACKKEETPAAAPAVKVVEAVKAPTPRIINLEVTEDGFVPANITMRQGEPVVFRVVRKTDETCATDLLIEGTDIKQALPLDKAVEVAWTPTKAGKIKFGCAMDMMIGGVFLVE